MSDDHSSQAIGAYGSRLAKLNPTPTIDRLAGGGVKRGYTHGVTNAFGYHAVHRPEPIHDLHATILHLLGFDQKRLIHRYNGLDVRLTGVSGDILRDIIA